MQNAQNKPYCLMPWIHLHVSNQGYVKACCVANITLGNINQQSLDNIWNGVEIEKLRRKFSIGEFDKRCAQCINLEATGGTSIRQETFNKFSDIDVLNPPKAPIYFDIRFSNVCNFRCRTCWHGASSKWFNDAKKLGRNVSSKSIIKNVDDFNEFIDKTGAALLNSKEIYFAGGEPLVTEEHYQLLEYLIQNKATKMLLRYNTNFSVLTFKNYDVLELWKKFERVEILASIDGYGALGEYIRKDMSWETFKSNRLKINGLSNITFKIAPTISVYNLYHLPDLYKKCLELKMISPLDFYINILERPNHFNIQIFPQATKIKISREFEAFYSWLEENHIPTQIKYQFQECIDYMNGEDQSKYWSKFIQETEILDELRDEKL